jgi:hypothetical protein
LLASYFYCIVGDDSNDFDGCSGRSSLLSVFDPTAEVEAKQGSGLYTIHGVYAKMSLILFF